MEKAIAYYEICQFSINYKSVILIVQVPGYGSHKSVGFKNAMIMIPAIKVLRMGDIHQT